MRNPSKKMILHSNNVISLYLIALPFLLWSFLGGNKQPIFGFNSDHIVTAYTLICTSLFVLIFPCYRSSLFKKHIKETIFILFFLFLIFLTSTFINSTHNINYNSFKYLALHSVYIIITINFIIIFSKNVPVFINILTVAVIGGVSFLLLSFTYLELGNWGRLTVPVWSNGSWRYFPKGYTSSSDPNVLAYMIIMMSYFVFVFNKNRSLARLLFISSLFCVFLTLSRSAILGFILACLLYFIIYVLKKRLLQTIILIPLFIILVIIFITALNDNLYSIITDNELIAERLTSTASNSDRISRLFIAFEELASFKPWLIGNGLSYSTQTSDPHNLYLSTIIDTGFLSLIIMFLALLQPTLTLRKNHKGYLFGLSIFIFFSIVSLFYWQVRTFYIALLLLNIANYYDNPYSKKK